MTAVVYILFSDKLDRFYTGITTLSINERLQNHLDKKYSNLNFTQKANDWTLVWELECPYSHALKIELHIKRMKSKVYIKNLMKYPEMKNKLLAFPIKARDIPETLLPGWKLGGGARSRLTKSLL